MALSYIKPTENEETVEITERLALTEDGRAVPEGSADARWLYAIPGQRIPRSEAERYGLLKTAEPAPGSISEPETVPERPRRGRPRTK
jgi:hypothetical protein